MKQVLYIKSTSAISPQHTFYPEQFLEPLVSSDDNKLRVIDIDYSKYISPVAIRRMSRLLKMGISSGMQSLKDAGISQPDGIITGTSHGSKKDMEQFVQDLIVLKEEALNPTYFIQSTYNSVNGWLAMQSKSTGYNQTYVHRGASFELALFDAWLMLQDAKRPEYYLVGGFDELTDNYFVIKSKIDYWKKENIDSLSLLEHSDTPGTIAGEGAAFFVATNDEKDALCAVPSIKMLQDPDAAAITKALAELLEENGIAIADIDVLLCGMNGDASTQDIYTPITENIDTRTTIATFKQLCGEYETTTGFALWLACQLITRQEIPEVIVHKKGSSNSIKYILLCNHSVFRNVSLTLVKAVK